MVKAILLAGAALVSQASAACTRALLQDAAAAYVKAQSTGQPSLLPLADNVTYAENDVSLNVKTGLLSQTVKIDFDRSVYDTTGCAAFTELSAATNSHPYGTYNTLYLI